jgi:molybdenum cofactor cytidylyltransferase
MISAIILAAGESKRMGQPKMLLKWGETTVIRRVITTFRDAGVEDILVITGGARELVERAIGDSTSIIFNAKYARGEMLSSVQAGLAEMKPDATAVLIGLGDQPQVDARSVRLVMDAYQRTGASIVVPSYQMHRGHPWLVARVHWNTIMQMHAPDSTRDFLNQQSREICYVDIDSPSILQDLDTPEDYLNSRP